MSLLNDMLHDLAKQKNVNRTIPLFLPSLSQSRNKSVISILLLCFVLTTFVFWGYLFNKSSEKTHYNTEQSTEEIRKDFPLTTIKPEPKEPDQVALVTPVKPVIMSYVEPLVSSASQRVAVQLPIDPKEALNDWLDDQGKSVSTVVNKVYLPQTIEEWHDTQLNKALYAIDKGLDEEAIAILKEILVKMPNASDVRENLTSLYLTYGNFAQAAEVVDEGLKYSPADPVLITIKARLFLDQGKTKEAIALLSQYRPALISYPDFYGTLAAALQSDGRILEAGSLYRSLLQIDPNDGRYWLGYAIALEHNKKINQAIEAYTRASQNPDSDPSVRDYSENRLKLLQG